MQSSNNQPALKIVAHAYTKRLKLYYGVIKPGIVYSNMMMAAAGYLLASKWQISWSLLFALLIGTGLVIASACVFNNYLDRDIDKKMERTSHRALVNGQMNGKDALIYATFLAILGFLALGIVSWLIVILGFVAIFGYVVVYGLAKRHTVYGTLVGSLPGSASIVAGYVTVSGVLNIEALMLFLIMASWQMAHFYAIATFRLQDYIAAKIPVWPAKKGVQSTRRQIVLYILIFIGLIISFSLLGYDSYIFAIVMTLLGFFWLSLALRRVPQNDESQWGRQIFFRSLVVLLVLALMLPVGILLPKAV